tara:strand:+ start:432 stop:986 length:555 start_codon:yes stop_codon:yes gene_type:complete
LIFLKPRDNANSWVTYDATSGATNYMALQTTQATSANSSRWNNTTPTSTVFSIGTHVSPNTNGDAVIAYCFNSVDGYSKVGSYTGNGSADGPFVHCGFKPALVIVKNSSTTGNWRMYDSDRAGYNSQNNTLYADGSYAEDATADRIDLLSNGFKIRSAGTNNASGVTVIFLAFAENPFKHTNAR